MMLAVLLEETHSYEEQIICPVPGYNRQGVSIRYKSLRSGMRKGRKKEA